jgi:hypothetical protein
MRQLSCPFRQLSAFAAEANALSIAAETADI